MDLFIKLTVATISSLVIGYCWCWSVFSYWEKRNLKGPKPKPLVGNLISIVTEDRQKLDPRWFKKYGKVFGVYIAMKPQIFVADPEVMIQMCVRDFNQMPNHDNYMNKEKLKILGNYLFHLMDDSWRRVRGLISPTFTSSKVKRMFPLLNECADDLVADAEEKLASSKDGIIDIKNLFHSYSMSGIASCCYGMKLGRSVASDTKMKAARDFFIKYGSEIFKPDYLTIVLYFILPQEVRKYFAIHPQSEKSLEFIATKVREIIKHRRKSLLKHDDLLQLILEANSKSELEIDEVDAKENHYANLSTESMKQDQTEMVSSIDKNKDYLTEIEVVANSTAMLPAGLETSGTLMAIACYCLAHHPDIQEKLYQELNGLFKNNSKLDYEILVGSQYLDCVISEALRILTPIAYVERQLNQDYRLEKYNLDLPKGMKINLCLHAVMNDPDYWPEPDKFKPDRFLPENKDKIVPGSYCPFGLGRRYCVAMKFALSESKVGVAKILLKYQLTPAPDTTFPPPVMAPASITILKKPFVVFKARSSP